MSCSRTVPPCNGRITASPRIIYLVIYRLFIHPRCFSRRNFWTINHITSKNFQTSILTFGVCQFPPGVYLWFFKETPGAILWNLLFEFLAFLQPSTQARLKYLGGNWGWILAWFLICLGFPILQHRLNILDSKNLIKSSSSPRWHFQDSITTKNDNHQNHLLVYTPNSKNTHPPRLHFDHHLPTHGLN